MLFFNFIFCIILFLECTRCGQVKKVTSVADVKQISQLEIIVVNLELALGGVFFSYGLYCECNQSFTLFLICESSQNPFFVGSKQMIGSELQAIRWNVQYLPVEFVKRSWCFTRHMWTGIVVHQHNAKV